MSYDFRLLLSGLCAFVPDEDIEEALHGGPAPELVTVLLISTKTRIEQAGGGTVIGSESHQPLLTFDLGGVGDGAGGLGKNRGAWVLDGEDVTVRFMRGDVEYPVGPLRVRIDDTERSFSLIPSMEHVLPGAGQVDPDCLGELADTAGKLVRARVYLDKGTLFTGEVARYKNEKVTAQFVPPPGEDLDVCKQFLPRKIALEVASIPEDVTVVIRARSIKAPDKYRDLPLYPVADPEEGTKSVQVEVRNFCCDSVLMDKEVETFPEPDLDFNYYYQIAANFVQLARNYVKFPVPVPVEFCNATEGPEGGGDTIRCSVARFSAPGPSREENATSDSKEED